MSGTQAVSIRTMTPADIDFATGLTHAAGWASESLDVFAGFLEHDPHGCFIAAAGREKAGVCVATKYRKSGFIGELVVSRHMRLLGIGQMLFQKALDYLLAARLESIYLDGDLNAVSYYETMGFRKVCRSLRFRGKIKGKKHAQVRHLNPDDLQELCRLDREWFGDDRGFFLRRRVENFPGLCLASEREGHLRGWIMARPGDGLLAVGPWASISGNEDAASLLEHLANEDSAAVFRIGVHEKNLDAVRLLRSWLGLQETIHSWFMVRGESDRLGDHPALYAIGSGAKG
ncbi:MAG: GNAT family N-acetyltransferase [Candidatus Aminicenantes bacterium]|nr:GNAT family N-acetyltransferase [Candidatus Aminicenantes bacterium]